MTIFFINMSTFDACLSNLREGALYHDGIIYILKHACHSSTTATGANNTFTLDWHWSESNATGRDPPAKREVVLSDVCKSLFCLHDYIWAATHAYPLGSHNIA